MARHATQITPGTTQALPVPVGWWWAQEVVVTVSWWHLRHLAGAAIHHRQPAPLYTLTNRFGQTS